MPKPPRKTVTDTSLMPWGEHKGTAMQDVPASYLLWLFKQPWIKDWPEIHAYLVANQDVLLAEDNEGGSTDGFDSIDDYFKYGR
jgi:hypothetical protein